MLLKNIALISLAALVAANEAVPESATTMVAVPISSEDHSENPEDIKQFMKKKCPEQKCPKPKRDTLTKNITKKATKTVYKTVGSCETQAPQKKCGGKNC
jgi:hypothetical protein